MSKDKTMGELKDEIYKLIREYFGNPEELCHCVGRDFSEDNLDECLSFYRDYINK